MDFKRHFYIKIVAAVIKRKVENVKGETFVTIELIILLTVRHNNNSGMILSLSGRLFCKPIASMKTIDGDLINL
jgi:hypothetical protein